MPTKPANVLSTTSSVHASQSLTGVGRPHQFTQHRAETRSRTCTSYQNLHIWSQVSYCCFIFSLNLNQGCYIWSPIGPDWHQMGQMWDFILAHWLACQIWDHSLKLCGLFTSSPVDNLKCNTSYTSKTVYNFSFLFIFPIRIPTCVRQCVFCVDLRSAMFV